MSSKTLLFLLLLVLAGCSGSSRKAGPGQPETPPPSYHAQGSPMYTDSSLAALGKRLLEQEPENFFRLIDLLEKGSEVASDMSPVHQAAYIDSVSSVAQGSALIQQSIAAAFKAVSDVASAMRLLSGLVTTVKAMLTVHTLPEPLQCEYRRLYNGKTGTTFHLFSPIHLEVEPTRYFVSCQSPGGERTQAVELVCRRLCSVTLDFTPGGKQTGRSEL